MDKLAMSMPAMEPDSTIDATDIPSLNTAMHIDNAVGATDMPATTTPAITMPAATMATMHGYPVGYAPLTTAMNTPAATTATRHNYLVGYAPDTTAMNMPSATTASRHGYLVGYAPITTAMNMPSATTASRHGYLVGYAPHTSAMSMPAATTATRHGYLVGYSPDTSAITMPAATTAPMHSYLVGYAPDTSATIMPARELGTIMEGDGHETTQDNVSARPTGIVPQQARHFPIMRLPTEIRLMVFKEVLQMAYPILFRCYGRSYKKRPAPYSIIRNSPKLESWRIPESIKIKQKEILPIFTVSKTICMETMPLYYPKNTFTFDDLDTFALFADKMSYYDESTNKYIAQGRMTVQDRRTANIKTITSLDINWYGRAPARAAKKLVKFEGLRKLTIHIHTLGVARVTNEKPYQMELHGMQHLLEVRGLEELQLKFSEHVRCYRKGTPHEVKYGLYNLAEGESRAALENTLEVLKEEKKVKNRNKTRGQKAKKVQAGAEEMDQKA